MYLNIETPEDGFTTQQEEAIGILNLIGGMALVPEEEEEEFFNHFCADTGLTLTLVEDDGSEVTYTPQEVEEDNSYVAYYGETQPVEEPEPMGKTVPLPSFSFLKDLTEDEAMELLFNVGETFYHGTKEDKNLLMDSCTYTFEGE